MEQDVIYRKARKCLLRAAQQRLKLGACLDHGMSRENNSFMWWYKKSGCSDGSTGGSRNFVAYAIQLDPCSAGLKDICNFVDPHWVCH